MVERTPAFSKAYGSIPPGARRIDVLRPFLIAALGVIVAALVVILLVTPADIVAGVVVLADIVVAVVVVSVAGLVAWKTRPSGWGTKMVSVAANGVVFTGDDVIAAGPQMVVARIVPNVAVKISPTGSVFVGGKPISRVAPFSLAADVRRHFASQLTVTGVDVMVAVKGWDGDAMLVPAGKRTVWLLPLDDLPAAILGAPARIDGTVPASSFHTLALQK